jgi:hypothetical protein
MEFTAFGGAIDPALEACDAVVRPRSHRHGALLGVRRSAGSRNHWLAASIARVSESDRVILDCVEALFAGIRNESILRAELRRLFAWLKQRGISAVITAERGEGTLTRNGLEEYVSDCVILLDNRVVDQITTRRLRVVKYRGSAHATDEYPFLIDKEGISVLPITTALLAHSSSEEVVSSGVRGVDLMLSAGGSSSARAYSSRALPVLVRRVSPASSPTPAVAQAGAVCSSRSRNHPSRSRAICSP